MKNIFDRFLLNRHFHQRPMKSRLRLLLLVLCGGLVVVLRFWIRAGLYPDLSSILTGAGLIGFTGVFSVIAFCWPAADFLCSLNPETECFQFNSKRTRLIRGFLYALILTGTMAGILDYAVIRIADYALSRVLFAIISVLAAVWAGGMLSRCAFTVFETVHKKKYVVFISLSLWYYVIVQLLIHTVVQWVFRLYQ